MLLALGAGVPPIVVPVLFPRIAADLGSFSPGLLGLATTLYFACSSVASPVGGRVADRLGPRVGARVAAGASMLVVAVLALAPGPWWIVAVMTFGGLVHGFANTVSTLVLSAVIGGIRPATQFGARQSSVPVLSLLAGVGLSAGLGLSWRLLVALFLVFPLASLWVRPPRRQYRPRAVASEPRAAPVTSMAMGSHVAVAALSGLCVASLATYGVLALVEGGWTEQGAGAIYATAAVVSLLLRVAVGALADHRDVSVLSLVGLLLSVGALGFGLLAAGGLAATSAGMLLAYGVGWSYPGLLYYSVARTFPGSVGRAAGWMQAGGAVGVSMGPTTFALVEGRWGMGPAWLGVTVVAALAASTAVTSGRLSTS